MTWGGLRGPRSWISSTLLALADEIVRQFRHRYGRPPVATIRDCARAYDPIDAIYAASGEGTVEKE